MKYCPRQSASRIEKRQLKMELGISGSLIWKYNGIV